VKSSLLSLGNTKVVDIYGVGKNVQKGDLYKAATKLAGSISTFSTIDKTVHSKKRRILAPAFTETALLTMQTYVLDQISLFIDTLSGAKSGLKDNWTGDMSLWCNYLTFDVMGELAFGKQFDMLTSEEMRGIPGLIDQNLFRQHIVSTLGCTRPCLFAP